MDERMAVLESDVEVGPASLPGAIARSWDAANGEIFAPASAVEERLARELAAGIRCSRLAPWQAALLAAGATCFEGGLVPERAAVALVRNDQVFIVHLGKPVRGVKRPVPAGASGAEVAEILVRPIQSWGGVSEIGLLASQGDPLLTALRQAPGVPVRATTLSDSETPSDWLLMGAGRAAAQVDLRPDAYAKSLEHLGWIEKIERTALVAIAAAAIVIAVGMWTASRWSADRARPDAARTAPEVQNAADV